MIKLVKLAVLLPLVAGTLVIFGICVGLQRLSQQS
jgi:hypothetical protein